MDANDDNTNNADNMGNASNVGTSHSRLMGEAKIF
jgi:hypothetical protein